MSTQRVYWRSRRGMLELELLLLPFARSMFPVLSEPDQRAFARLLDHDDWDIFDWLQQRATPEDPDLARIVDRIRAFQPGI